MDMNRILADQNPDLDALRDERDHVSILISLLPDANEPDPRRMELLKDQLSKLERRIAMYKSPYA